MDGEIALRSVLLDTSPGISNDCKGMTKFVPLVPPVVEHQYSWAEVLKRLQVSQAIETLPSNWWGSCSAQH